MQSLNDVIAAVEPWLVKNALPPVDGNVVRAIDALHIALPSRDINQLTLQLQSRLLGYGELESLMLLKPTDVLVNAPDSVWIDNGEGLQRADVRFESEVAVRRLAMRLAHSAHRRLDDAQPYVDALLDDGVRLHAVIPPIATTHTAISLRIPQQRVIPLRQWFADLNVAQKFDDAIKRGQSLVISGATGSGKTTLIRSLLAESYASRRVVVIEDVAEINDRSPNIIALQGRSANSEGIGSITLRSLVRQTLRMRPDAIVVGELRGAEAVDWLLSVSSGHHGSLTTVHAASAKQARERLNLLCALGNIDTNAIAKLLTSQELTFVHCQRTTQGRFITEVVS
jgi:pilus assembly protein CpaF